MARETGTNEIDLASRSGPVRRPSGPIASVNKGVLAQAALPLVSPLPRLANAADLPSGAAPSIGCRPLRILVVEDNVTNRIVSVSRLELLGHDVDAVSDGVEALIAIQASLYDLILMDVVMPGMSGLAATRLIRALGGAANRTPIVALTANILPEHRAECRAAGMNGFLAKPFNQQQLAGILAPLLAAPDSPSPAQSDEPKVRRTPTSEIGPDGAAVLMEIFAVEAYEYLVEMACVARPADGCSLGVQAQALLHTSDGPEIHPSGRKAKQSPDALVLTTPAHDVFIHDATNEAHLYRQVAHGPLAG